jgi:hypothetical protein
VPFLLVDILSWVPLPEALELLPALWTPISLYDLTSTFFPKEIFFLLEHFSSMKYFGEKKQKFQS